MENANISTKIKFISLKKSLGLVIILEIFLSIICIFIDYNKSHSIGGELFINCVSMLTKTLLTLSILKNSKMLFWGASVIMFLKFISAIGIFKHKKYFSIFTTFLYFADFICILYLFFTNATMLTELSKYSIISAVGHIILIGLLIIFSFLSFFVFDNRCFVKPILEKHNKSTRFAIFSLIVVIVVIEVTVIVLSFANKDNVFATKAEIQLVNRCYEYLKKYCMKNFHKMKPS